MKSPLVLDSFALVSFFHKESSWEKVRDHLRRLSSAGEKAYLCRINWGEFYSIVKRRAGKLKAEESLLLLQQLPIDFLPVDDDLVKEAAEIKSDYPLSYADAFCIATALRVKGRILTSDPEFLAVEHLVTVLWLNQKIKG